MMPARDLGTLGESAVLGWAAQVGIVANKSCYDKKGWDFHLQFSYANPATHIDFPLDRRPPELACMVQVKSTDKNSGKIGTIKLSNWERMAKHPLPYFFLVIEFDGKDSAQRAYLVHVDEYWIGKTLKRLRELGTHPPKPLNRYTMQLTYSPSDMIDSPNGASLEESIRRNVGDNPQEYFMEKYNWLNNVGYDQYRSRCHFTLHQMSYDKIMETLVDFAIGITKEISLESVCFEDVRFGIPQSLYPQIEPVNPRITVDKVPPAGEAEIIISDEDGSNVFQDSMAYYSPDILFPFIPANHWKVRFYSEICSFILSRDNKFDLRFNLFQPDVPMPISKLSKVSNFIRHFTKPENKVYKVEITANNKTFDLDVHSDELPPINAFWDKILSTIENATFLIRCFEQFDDIEVTLSELVRQESRLNMMKIYLNEDRLGHMSLIVNDIESINLNSLAFVNCLYVVFGKKVFLISGALRGIGKIKEEDGGHRVTIQNGMSKCIKKRLMSINKAKVFSMKNFADQAYRVLDEQGIESVVIIEGQPTLNTNMEQFLAID